MELSGVEVVAGGTWSPLKGVRAHKGPARSCRWQSRHVKFRVTQRDHREGGGGLWPMTWFMMS